MKNRSAAGSCATAGSTSPNRPLFDSSAAVMSIGFVAVAKPGSRSATPCRVWADSAASGRPNSSDASAPITQLAPELLMTTSRRPSGRQPLRYASAASACACGSRTRQMP